jgi:hypothetical protein
VTAAAEELALGEDQKGNVKLAAKYIHTTYTA